MTEGGGFKIHNLKINFNICIKYGIIKLNQAFILKE